MMEHAQRPDSQGTGRPLLFTSIPKCGKNLVISFLQTLGYKRIMLDGNAVNLAIYARRFAEYSGRASYVYPWLEHADQSEGIFRAFGQSLSRLGTNEFHHQHTVFDERFADLVRKANLPILLIYRDPRDVIVSALNYARNQNLPTHIATAIRELETEEALIFLITGNDKLVPFGNYFDSFSDWKRVPGTLCLRFEDMIGPKGGGDRDRQVEAFTSLVEHLGWAGSNQRLEQAVDAAFNPRAGTFYKGQIGTWKEYFSADVERVFNRLHGNLLSNWGYK